MTLAPRASVFLLFGLAGCGTASGSPSSAPPSDASASDATVDTNQGPPPGDTGPAGDAAGISVGDEAGPVCDMMEAMVNQLAAAAEACCPNCGQPQCTAAVQGVCCPVTISSTTSQDAINNFETAVTAFQSQCSPKCSSKVCPPTPSKICIGSGMAGSCQ
jgi:hypothetical protein